MQMEKILLGLDHEIARLQKVRTLLSVDSAVTSSHTAKRKPGRPAGAAKLTPQARKRIAEAMKKSWAARKKAAATERG